MINKILEYYRSLVDERIDKLFPKMDTGYKRVVEAARYSILNGGKRIRPVIMMEFCKLCGGNEKDALDFAVALEMIHTYSLIHDDLPCMDNDDMRRGKPSCHKAYGEDTALLAGDSLLTKAFSVAAASDVADDRKIRAIKLLADLAGVNGMIGGQVMDLDFEQNKPDQKELQVMYILKTGCLIWAAAEIGCIIAGAEEETVNKAKSYALNVAIAFQIIDDILDIVGDEKVLGKPVGSDCQNQKHTWVTLNGLENSKLKAESCTKEALGLLESINGDTKVLQELTKYLLARNY
ncbi:MAG: polyprenyl synthetase family protein [Clostridia bacterium]|nr:polyprenyl synthetase family protein [Clostridia bacterium]